MNGCCASHRASSNVGGNAIKKSKQESGRLDRSTCMMVVVISLVLEVVETRTGAVTDGLKIGLVVSGLLVGTEMTGILLVGVTGYVVRVVRIGQLVTPGGQLVIVIVSVV